MNGNNMSSVEEVVEIIRDYVFRYIDFEYYDRGTCDMLNIILGRIAYATGSAEAALLDLDIEFNKDQMDDDFAGTAEGAVLSLIDYIESGIIGVWKGAAERFNQWCNVEWVSEALPACLRMYRFLRKEISERCSDAEECYRETFGIWEREHPEVFAKLMKVNDLIGPEGNPSETAYMDLDEL